MNSRQDPAQDSRGAVQDRPASGLAPRKRNARQTAGPEAPMLDGPHRRSCPATAFGREKVRSRYEDQTRRQLRAVRQGPAYRASFCYPRSDRSHRSSPDPESRRSILKSGPALLAGALSTVALLSLRRIVGARSLRGRSRLPLLGRTVAPASALITKSGGTAEGGFKSRYKASRHESGKSVRLLRTFAEPISV